MRHHDYEFDVVISLKGAQQLIDAIEKHGAIIVEAEY